MVDTAPSSELHDMVMAKLASRDIRYTRGRRSVVAAIQMSSGPRTAAELHHHTARDAAPSSLYRTLVILEECDVVRKHHGPDGTARYELAESLTGHHHHVVCVACGAIEDVTVAKRAERELLSIVESLGAQAGYRVLNHVLEVEGVCPNCDQLAPAT
jgi:Fe2+ or Zn2+ uptake regulation protein